MFAIHRDGISAAFLVIAGALLAGCSSPGKPASGLSSAVNPVNWITPYRADIIQGNFVSREQVEQLRPGMTRTDVRNVLGTPLLTSVFHGDRWDYVFTFKRQGVEPQSFKYTVFFKGDTLERFEGDTMPSELEFIARLDTRRKLGKVPVLEATEEQLKSAASKSAAASGSAPASPAISPPAAAAASYPPLESTRQ